MAYRFKSKEFLGSTGTFSKSLTISGVSVLTGININTGSFVTTGQTGSFITTGQTGTFASAANLAQTGATLSSWTGTSTGLYYPRTSNPSGYLTGFNSGQYVTTGSTGVFVTTGQTGIFITTGQTGAFASAANLAQTGATLSNWTGASTGLYYPLSSNPSGYITTGQTGVFVTTGQTGNFLTIYSNVVYTTGNQTISGTKTFASSGIFNSGVSVSGISKFYNRLDVSGVKFDVLSGASATPVYQEGLVWYSDDNKTLNLYNDISTAPLLIGEEEVVRGVNNLGFTINKGQVVYITGGGGGDKFPAFQLSIASGEEGSARTIGIATSNISNNQKGYAISFGRLEGIDTSLYEVGQSLYLSWEISGGLTGVKPQAPNHIVRIGNVIRQGNSSNGVIFVKIENGVELDELHDVRIVNKQNKDAIFWDSGSGLWLNRQITTGDVNGINNFVRYDYVNKPTYLKIRDNASDVDVFDYSVDEFFVLRGLNGAAEVALYPFVGLPYISGFENIYSTNIYKNGYSVISQPDLDVSLYAGYDSVNTYSFVLNATNGFFVVNNRFFNTGTSLYEATPAINFVVDSTFDLIGSGDTKISMYGKSIEGFNVISGTNIYQNGSLVATDSNLSSTGSTLQGQITSLKNWTGASTGLYYPRTSNPSGYVTTGQTGTFASAANLAQTGATLSNWTGASTGLYYPRSSNPSGYVLSSQTGNFVTTSQTGLFYPASNPSGFITSAGLGGVNSINVTGSIVSGNVILTGAGGTTISLNGQTITISSSGGSSPSSEGVTLPIIFKTLNLAGGSDNTFVQFTNNFSAIPSVWATIVNNSGDPFLGYNISGISTSGFYLSTSTIIPTNNYKLNYIATTGDGFLNIGTVTGSINGQNIGDGSGILSGTANNTLNFKTLKAGQNIVISGDSSNQTLTIHSTGSSSSNSISNFSKGGGIYSLDGIPSGTYTIPIWRAHDACRITGIHGYRIGGTAASINVTENNVRLFASPISITSTGVWISSSLISSGIVVGDDIEIEITSVSGFPTGVSVQVDFSP